MKDKEKRKRLNIILDVCKFRKDKNALACFDDDCQEIKELPIVSRRIRRHGDGSIKTTETSTGNIIVSCEVHDWRQMFSTWQLDNRAMPARTTSVADVIPRVESPESNVVER